MGKLDMLVLGQYMLVKVVIFIFADYVLWVVVDDDREMYLSFGGIALKIVSLTGEYA